MFRYVLSLTFVVGLASAATISTTATCDGVTTVGTFSASCNHGTSTAQASLEIDGHFSVFAEATTSDFGGGEDIATANFSDDYVFTVFGGSGNGFFNPCFVGGGDGHVSMSFADDSYDATGRGLNSTNCVGPIIFESFTFGVPQIVPITMFANVSQPLRFAEGIVSESLDHILFFDPLRNPLSNITFTLVEVPEPSSWSLLGVGSMFFLAVAVSFRSYGRSRCV
jgi:hypothetical protein